MFSVQSHEQMHIPKFRGFTSLIEGHIFIQTGPFVLAPVSKPLPGLGVLGAEISKGQSFICVSLKLQLFPGFCELVQILQQSLLENLKYFVWKNQQFRCKNNSRECPILLLYLHCSQFPLLATGLNFPSGNLLKAQVSWRKLLHLHLLSLFGWCLGTTIIIRPLDYLLELIA